MQAEPTDNRSYYDAFAERYDQGRDHGYHKLIDDQAAAIVRRYSDDRDVLEVGCGTGLILQRVAPHTRSARGVDLSPGMLEGARARGLDVQEGSATALPFADASFDLAYSFKVLAHIPDWDACMREYLGLSTIDNMKDGPMQDVHWPSGALGYFPSYTLGAIIAAQLWAAIERDHPAARDDMRHGRFVALNDWRRDKVWCEASKYSTPELLRRATGEALSAKHFEEHLRQRYLA